MINKLIKEIFYGVVIIILTLLMFSLIVPFLYLIVTGRPMMILIIKLCKKTYFFNSKRSEK